MGLLDLFRGPLFRGPGGRKNPRHADELALVHLEKRGADLSQSRHVIHFLYFEREEDARAAADDAGRAGWSTNVDEPGVKITFWTMRADGNRVLSGVTVASFRSWFEQLAAEHGGEYDGWEAAPKP